MRSAVAELVVSRRSAVAMVLTLLWSAGSLGAEPREHLHFFRANRDFVLRAFERLPRAGGDPADSTRAWDFDPFGDWSVQERVRAVRAALDTAQAPADLGHFRSALGALLDEAALAGGRLDDLEHRFAAHLRTACEVTLAGDPNVDVERVEAWLDGEAVAAHTTSPEERAALAAGGVLEVVRRVLEPRSQDLQLKVWIAGTGTPIELAERLEPVSDALVRLHVELSPGAAPRVVQTTVAGSP